jgi:hypothetical protein
MRSDGLDTLVFILDPVSLWFEVIGAPRLANLMYERQILGRYWVDSRGVWTVHVSQLGDAIKELLSSRIPFEVRLKGQSPDLPNLFEEVYGR